MGEISEALRRSQEQAGREPQSQPAIRESLGAEIHRSAPPRGQPIRLPSQQPAADQVLGREPHPISREIDPERGAARVSLLDPHSDAAQAYRRMAFRIHSLVEESRIASLVVTSTLPREGKTTIACNLAIELTRLDHSQKIALIEMDFRRPMIAKSLGLSPRAGVEDVLGEKAEISEAMISTDLPGLDVMMVRQSISNPDRQLSSHRISSFLRSLEERYSLVLIDTPPLVVGTDASVILRHASMGILVAAAGSSPSRRVKHAASLIPKEKLLGCVLNYARPKAIKSEYASYYSETIDAEEAHPEDPRA